jgi:hypothetical protein
VSAPTELLELDFSTRLYWIWEGSIEKKAAGWQKTKSTDIRAAAAMAAS